MANVTGSPGSRGEPVLTGSKGSKGGKVSAGQVNCVRELFGK